MATIRDLTVRLDVEARTKEGVTRTQVAFREIVRSAEAAQQQLDRTGVQANKTDGIFSRMSSNVSSFSRGFASIGTTVGKASVLIAGGAVALGGLAGATSAAIVPILGLTAAISPVIGLAAGLPGVFVAGKAAMEIFQLATGRFQGALQALAKGGVEELAGVMDDLGPVARRFAEHIAAVWPVLEGIRERIENAFFAAFVQHDLFESWPTLMDFVAAAANRLSPALERVAGFMGNIVTVAIEWGTSLTAFIHMEKILNSIVWVLMQMQDAVEPLLRGFFAISALGAGFFATFAVPLSKILTQFGLWLEKIVRTGEALMWLNNAWEVLKQFSVLLFDLTSLFAGLIRAMQDAGLGALGVLGQLVKAMNTWVQSSEGQKVLIEIFKALHAIGEAFIPVLRGIIEALGGFAPVIARLATTAAPILINVLNAINFGLQGIAPGVEILVKAFGDGIADLVPAVIELGKAFGLILYAISPLLPKLAGIAQFLGISLANEVKQLVPLLRLFVEVLGHSLQIMAPLGSAILRLVAGGLSVFLEMLIRILPTVAEIVMILGTFFVQVLFEILNAVAGVLPYIADLVRLWGIEFIKALKVLLPMLQDVIVQWIRLLPAILNLLPPLIEFGMKLLPIIVDAFRAMLPHSEMFARLLAEILTRLIPLIPEFYSLANALIPLAADLARLAIVVSTMLLPIVERMLPIVIKVTEGIVRFFTWMFNVLVGNSIIPDLAEQIIAWWHWAVNGVKSVVQWFVNLPGMFAEWLSDLLDTVVRWLSAVVDWFKALPGWVVSAISGLAQKLYDAGREILQGLIDGLWSMYGNVMNTVGDILGRIRSAFPFSPAKWGPFSGRGYTLFSGQAIIRDFAKGIRSQDGLVKSALDDVLSHEFQPDLPGMSGKWSANVTMPIGMGGGVVIQNLTLQFADDRDMYTKGKEFADGLREYRRRGGKLPT